MRWHNLVVAGLAALAVGPATTPAQVLSAQLGPALILEDSVVLGETDDHYVGQPVSLIPLDDGSFLITDGFSNSALQFDAHGRYQRTFGRKGDGAGEFRFVSYAAFVTDEVVGIGDDDAMELELFDRHTGAHIGAIGMTVLIDQYVVSGDTVWFGGVDTESWTSIGSAALDDLVAVASSGGGNGTVLLPDRVAAPRIYVENEVTMSMLAGVALDVGERVVVVGFAGSPTLLVASPSGDVLDSLGIPPTRRRGLPEEQEFLGLERGPRSTAIYDRMSYLVKVSYDSIGFVHTVHQDSNYDPESRQMRGAFFVSSVKADGAKICSDTLVPTSDAGLPELTLQGSRLYVLDQRTAGGGVRTVIRSFTIDPENCTGGIVEG